MLLSPIKTWAHILYISAYWQLLSVVLYKGAPRQFTNSKTGTSSVADGKSLPQTNLLVHLLQKDPLPPETGP